MLKQNVSAGFQCNKMTTTDGMTSTAQKIYNCMEKHVHSISLFAAEKNQSLRFSTQTLTQREPRDTRHSVCQTVALSPAGFLCCIWQNVIFTLQYVLPFKYTPEVHREHSHTHTHTEATFNRKALFQSVDSGAKHTARVLICCHNLS